MDVDELGLTLRLPFTTDILEVTHQLFLLRIDRDDRNAALEPVFGLGVDVLELGISVWMLSTFDGLARRLKAVPVGAQQLGYGLVAEVDAMALEQLIRQHACALARPPKR